jgi:hypothetical protein
MTPFCFSAEGIAGLQNCGVEVKQHLHPTGA